MNLNFIAMLLKMVAQAKMGGVNSCQYVMGWVVECVRSHLNLPLKKPLGDAFFLFIFPSEVETDEGLSTDCQGPLQGLTL